MGLEALVRVFGPRRELRDTVQEPGASMIYKREDYVEEAGPDAKFPVRQIDVLTDVETGEAKFVGHVTLGLQTPMGVQQIPISFEIDAPDIKGAFGKFDASAEPKIEQARKGIEDEIQRLRQEASSRIVRPGEVGMGGGGNHILDFDKLKGQ